LEFIAGWVSIWNMKTFKVHYDGHVLVPDEPVDLPLNSPLELSVVSRDKESDIPADLDRLAALAKSRPAGASTRSDLAAQHDHYLYGAPKRS